MYMLMHIKGLFHVLSSSQLQKNTESHFFHLQALLRDGRNYEN